MLVHGAYHGAWCWDLVRPELARRGHAVVTADLPCETSTAGADRYASAVVDAMSPATERAVLVGHSLGGLTIPVLASFTPTRLMVFLAAVLPQPGSSFDDQGAGMDTGYRPAQPAIANPDGSSSWPVPGAIEVVYHDCPPDLALCAAQRLRRQHWRITQELTPLEEWPAIPSAYIVARDDRVIAPAYGREIARRRLGVDPVEIDGGHAPFLARPAELASVLSALAESS